MSSNEPHVAKIAALIGDPARANILKENIIKWGLGNTMVTQNDPEHFGELHGFFDLVLVDAPCSGLGTLRRNPDLKWRQSPQAVEELNAKQTAILASASRLLKPGGRLVYATCSLLAAENEAIGEAFAALHPGFEKLDAAAILDGLGVSDAAGLTTAGNLRLWPHLHATDGFFAMIWRKN